MLTATKYWGLLCTEPCTKLFTNKVSVCIPLHAPSHSLSSSHIGLNAH